VPVAKQLEPLQQEPGEGEGDDEQDDPPKPICFFDDLEGFKCTLGDANMRECFGMNGTQKGTSTKRICKKDGGQPCWYHHTCYTNFYTEHKKKVLKEDEECNFCPTCKKPEFGRKARS
jgi:hypothetical protein